MKEQKLPLIKPTSDVFIATFLSASDNEQLLCSIINAVLIDKGNYRPIKQATVVNPFNCRNHADDKSIVLDVRVVDELGRVFNIEIQTHPQQGFRERILYGWSRSYSSQLPVGINYVGLKPVVAIVITEFVVFRGFPKVHLIFKLCELGEPKLLLSEHCQIHFWQLREVILEHNKALREVSPNLVHWSQFFAHGNKKSEVEMSVLTENDPLVMRAFREFQRFNADPEMREFIRRRHMFQIDQQMRLANMEEKWKARNAKAERKILKAEKKLRVDKIETVRKLKLLGVDCETIAKATGFSVGDVESL